MRHEHHRTIIIGAGAMGAAAAYQLAKRGEPVLLLEQFALGHPHGSSHGAGRIIRHSYADPHCARLMPAAFQAWRELEADAGESLYVRCGGVSLCPRGVDYVEHATVNLDALGVPHRRMTGHELHRIHHAFHVPIDCDVVFEPDAGILAAARAVGLQIHLAESCGLDTTIVKDRTPVRGLDLQQESPVVLTDDVRYTTDRLVITAGAWIRRLIPQLASWFRVERQQVFYFRPTDHQDFSLGKFPIWIYLGHSPFEAFYGMPEHLGFGVKAARHGGIVIDPDSPHPDTDGSERQRAETTLRTFLRALLPALAEAPIDHHETCLYTIAPQDQFLIDLMPGRPDVILASPCSGHGFKFSALVGRIVADLVGSGDSEIDLAPWRFPAECRQP